ncbi:MAG: hypothetical protein R3B13_32365 [Polyangiaceae bacterium]
MTTELGKRLLLAERIGVRTIESALFDAVDKRIALVQALAARGHEVTARLRAELERSDLEELQSAVVDAELAALLPAGLCQRLLAVPLGRHGGTGVISVGVVDPFDLHAARELSFHLDAPVRRYRISLETFSAALEAWIDEMEASLGGKTPAFGTLVARRPSRTPVRFSLPPRPPVAPRAVLRESEPPPSQPIPLVKKTLEAAARPRQTTSPGVGSIARPVIDVLADDEGEPVIGLYRSKPPPALQADEPPPQSIAILGAPEEVFEAAMSELATSEDPERIADLLAQGAISAASSALVLAVRAKRLLGRAVAGPVVELPDVRDIEIPRRLSRALDTALGTGHFLGSLPQDAVHAPLARVLGDGEVYLTRVSVYGRPTLLLALGRIISSFDASRRADQLAEQAARRLERIVELRKER